MNRKQIIKHQIINELYGPAGLLARYYHGLDGSPSEQLQPAAITLRGPGKKRVPVPEHVPEDPSFSPFNKETGELNYPTGPVQQALGLELAKKLAQRKRDLSLNTAARLAGGIGTNPNHPEHTTQAVLKKLGLAFAKTPGQSTKDFVTIPNERVLSYAKRTGKDILDNLRRIPDLRKEVAKPAPKLIPVIRKDTGEELMIKSRLRSPDEGRAGARRIAAEWHADQAKRIEDVTFPKLVARSDKLGRGTPA